MLTRESKIFVAGHKGLLGSSVCRALEQKGLSNVLTQSRADLDLRDASAVASFFEQEKPEFVFMCAAKVGGILANAQQPVNFFVDNMKIQLNVFESAHRFGVRKLLFVGSSCIYPKESPLPIAENSLLSGPLEQSNEAYALAKISGVRLCDYYRDQYACDFISAIPSNLYGINDNYDPHSSHVLPALIRKVHEAKVKGSAEVELWGTGLPKREFLLSDDCADGLIFLMQNYSERGPVNVGTGEDISILDALHLVAEVLKYPVKVKHDLSKPDGTFRKVTDVSRIQNLGWRHQYVLREGIEIAYQDFLNHVA